MSRDPLDDIQEARREMTRACKNDLGELLASLRKSEREHLDRIVNSITTEQAANA